VSVYLQLLLPLIRGVAIKMNANYVKRYVLPLHLDNVKSNYLKFRLVFTAISSLQAIFKCSCACGNLFVDIYQCII
jgi:hypothetical protein